MILKILVLCAGKTMKEAALDVGIHPSYITQVDRGERRYSDKLVKYIAGLYEVEEEKVRKFFDLPETEVMKKMKRILK